MKANIKQGYPRIINETTPKKEIQSTQLSVSPNPRLAAAMSPIDRRVRKRAKTEAEAAAKAKAEAMSSRSDQSENPALRALVDKLEGTKLDEPKISASPLHKGPKEHSPLIGVKHLRPEIEEIEEGFTGTTCAAIIGTNAIYLATDGRGSSSRNKGLIIEGNAVKIFEISKHIVAAVAGRSSRARLMVEQAKIAVKSVEYGVEEAMVRAKNAVIGFQKQCENGPSMLLCGTVNHEKTIFVIDMGEVSVIKGLRSHGTIGSGTPFASYYLKKTVDKCFYDKDYYNCLKESITFSSLLDRATGGKVLGARSGRRVLRFYEREHVVRCLQNRFKVFPAFFHVSLRKIIFCVTNTIIYDFTAEARFEGYIRTFFPSMAWFHVLVVDLEDKLTVRVMGFKTEEAKISALKGIDEVEGNLVPDKIGAQLNYKPDDGESHEVSLLLPSEDFINLYQDNSFDY